MRSTPASTHRSIRLITLFVAALAIAIVAMAGSAGAETPPQVPELDEKIPGPDLELIVPLDVHLVPLRPTVTAEVNCDAERIDVQVGNKTAAAWQIEITADDVVLTGGALGPNMAMAADIDVAENQTVHVEVIGGAATQLLDADITADCLLPLPSYEILTDCESGQAHARLINHGDDTAFMGVQYPAVMHMEIEVAPHSSEDWLLAVGPGETVEFDIMASNASIGSEALTFDCPVAAEEQVPADPTPEPEAQPEADTDATETDTTTEPDPVEPDSGEMEEQATDSNVEELAAGPDIIAGGTNVGSDDVPGTGVALGLVLIGLGLAALAGVVIATTAKRAHSR